MSHSHASIRPSQPVRVEGSDEHARTGTGCLEFEGQDGANMASIRFYELTPDEVDRIADELKRIALKWRERIAQQTWGKPLIDIL